MIISHQCSTQQNSYGDSSLSQQRKESLVYLHSRVHINPNVRWERYRQLSHNLGFRLTERSSPRIFFIWIVILRQIRLLLTAWTEQKETTYSPKLKTVLHIECVIVKPSKFLTWVFEGINAQVACLRKRIYTFSFLPQSTAQFRLRSTPLPARNWKFEHLLFLWEPMLCILQYK